MAPVLDRVAPKVKGEMAIGKIDCTLHKTLCNEYKVKGYPTLKLSRDGEVMDYPGRRDELEIINFARKMSQPPVQICSTYDDVVKKAKESSTGVIFLAYHPNMKGKGLTSKLSSQLLLQIFQQSARIQQAFADFCLLSPPLGEDDGAEGTDGSIDLSPFGPESSSEFGFIARVEADIKPVLWKFDPEEDLTSAKMIEFVKAKNVPTVSDLGPGNFHKIGHNGRTLVIGCVDGSDAAQTASMKQQLLEYASVKGPKSIVDQYYFGVMDGKQWHKFLAQFSVTPDELPQILVLNVVSKTFWQNTTYTNDVAKFLSDIETGVLESSASQASKGWQGWIYQAEYTFFKYLPWSLVALVAVCAVFVIILIPPPEELRPPYENGDEFLDEDNDEDDDAGAKESEEPKKDR